MRLFDRIDVLDESQSALRKIVRLAWPVAISMVFHTSYSVVDMFWVSGLGSEAVAAVTLGGVIFWAGFALSQVFGTGVHALVARAHGAQTRDRANQALRDGLAASVVTGALFAAVVACMAKRMLVLLGAESVVADTGIWYVRIMAAGSIVASALFTLTSAFRATGDMITPLLIAGVSCAANIVLDPIFIFGVGFVPAFGLAGAAVASVISIYGAFAWAVCLTERPAALLSLRVNGPPSLGALRDMFLVGLPSGLHYVLLSVTHMAMIRMVASFGTVEVAATGIGARITELSFLPCIAIGAATATMVGQYLGAQKTDGVGEVVASALKVNLMVTAIICSLYALFPSLLVRVFTDDPAVMRLGSVYLRISAVMFLFVTVTIVLTRVFQGAGDTVWPTAVALLRLAVFLGIAFALARWARLGVYGVWLAMLGSAAVQAGVVGWLYTLGTWKRKRLEFVEGGGDDC